MTETAADLAEKLRELAAELEGSGAEERPSLLRRAADQLEETADSLDDAQWRLSEVKPAPMRYADAFQALHTQAGHETLSTGYCREPCCVTLQELVEPSRAEQILRRPPWEPLRLLPSGPVHDSKKRGENMDALKKLFDDFETECSLHLMVEHGVPWEQSTAMARQARKSIEERIRRDPEYVVVLTEFRCVPPGWLN